MVEVIKREVAKFRIIILDTKTKKSKTISLKNGKGATLDDVTRKVESCFT